jgi:predicted nucleotidyltransferase
MNEQPKRDIVSALAEVSEVNLAYLFGSQVEGDVGPTSDYDLGVLLDHTASWPQIRVQLSHSLTHVLNTERIDLVLLNEAPVELAYAIIARGKVLYQRDVATRVEYEARVMSLYGDYLPILRAQRRDILRGHGHGTRVQRYRAALGRTERTLSQIRATHS